MSPTRSEAKGPQLLKPFSTEERVMLPSRKYALNFDSIFSADQIFFSFLERVLELVALLQAESLS